MAQPADASPPGRDSLDGRRRLDRTVSARSSLLTILGEFALPRDQPIWTATLVAALGALGVEEKAARQALARLSAEGLLVAERVGRRTRWALSASGQQLLDDGARRIYGFMQEQRAWDGRWLVLAVTVPETQRQLRHALRTRLSWIGLGSPATGLWVTPNAELGDEVAAIMTDLGINDAMSWVGPAGAVGEPEQVVRAAWQLDDVERAYTGFIDVFSVHTAETPADVFCAQVELVQAWRRFPFADPALPLELLDHEWPGPSAAATFRRCHEQWHEAAQQFWRTLTQAAD